jgi:transcriptional regulator with XRE-family HTH domain
MTDTAKRPKKSKSHAQAKHLEMSMSQIDNLAIELRRAREAATLSHSDLNRLTGISRSVLYGYEVGRTKPGAKELTLLCEALRVSPNRLLMGTEEPFKPITGLRTLAKLRKSPIMFLVAMMIVPTAMAVIDDDQAEALFTLIASMIESRDKDLYRKMSIIAEVCVEELGVGTPADMARFGELYKDEKFMQDFQDKVERRLKENNLS